MIAYLDESQGTNGSYWVNALVVSPGADAELERRISRLLTDARLRHGLAEHVELHGAEMVNASGAWRSLDGRHDLIWDILRAAIKAATSINSARVVCGHVDESWRRMAPAGADLHVVGLYLVLDRIGRICDREGGCAVTIIADEGKDRIAREAMQALEDLREDPEFARKHRMPKLTGPPKFVSSRDRPGVQGIDLITWVLQRFDCAYGGDLRGARRRRLNGALREVLRGLDPAIEPALRRRIEEFLQDAQRAPVVQEPSGG